MRRTITAGFLSRCGHLRYKLCRSLLQRFNAHIVAPGYGSSATEGLYLKTSLKILWYVSENKLHLQVSVYGRLGID